MIGFRRHSIQYHSDDSAATERTATEREVDALLCVAFVFPFFVCVCAGVVAIFSRNITLTLMFWCDAELNRPILMAVTFRANRQKEKRCISKRSCSIWWRTRIVVHFKSRLAGMRASATPAQNLILPPLSILITFFPPLSPPPFFCLVLSPPFFSFSLWSYFFYVAFCFVTNR